MDIIDAYKEVENMKLELVCVYKRIYHFLICLLESIVSNGVFAPPKLSSPIQRLITLLYSKIFPAPL